MSFGDEDALQLSVRLGGLQVVRLLLVGLAIAAGTTSGGASSPSPVWMPILLGYAVATGTFELARRRARLRCVGPTSVLLVVDALLIAAATTFDIGPSGPVAVLPALHTIAVVFLAGPASGTRTGSLHVALVFAALVHHTAEGTLRDEPSVYALVAATVIAAGAASAVLLNVVERAHRRRRERLAALALLAEACQRASSVDDISSALAATACTTFGFTDALVAFDVEDDHALGGARLLRRLHEEHEPVRSALDDPTNVVWVPLRDGNGRGLGVAVFVAGDDVPAISGDDVELLERLCSHAALAIVNLRLGQEIERLATTDALTGLPNRRQFEERFRAEAARARRHGLSFALVALDVDHFKSVNDTHGHAVGDDVLAGVARVLQREYRESDLAARTGGEEFVVLLPETELGEACAFAERLRAAVKRSGTVVPVTVSAGVAAFPATTAEVEPLLIEADRALYRAKGEGRDRVCAAQRTTPVRRLPDRRRKDGRRRHPLRSRAV